MPPMVLRVYMPHMVLRVYMPHRVVTYGRLTPEESDGESYTWFIRGFREV